ncbi:MAG TPA: ribosomal protein S18-alanine N-acetyltransferase [Methanobacterium sp.]|jgi:[ribosomal protein S18]-alanine N-acetyltransferase|nr:ribosomal protein S18-alanine N-acetyltransferase [Methanobacterium sp.]
MIIREFKRPDVKRVLEIEKASFSDPYPANILVDIYNLGAGFLVAQENNRLLGYIIFWIRFEDEGHIISIAVDKSYRRQDVGSKLVETSLEIFKKFKVKRIKLEVRVGNKGARKFYSKMGFKEEKIVEDYYEDLEDAVIMGREME